MKKYYKIISSSCLFAKAYGITDINSIQEGSQFVGYQLYDFADPKIVISGDKPMLHFTDCAFDTMLWWPIFSKTSYHQALFGYIVKSCIYEIIPITPVVKNRALNEHELFRCATNTIEFKKQIPIEQIAQLAIQEYQEHKLKTYFRYGSQFVKERVDLWQQGRYS
jgi:hypothetical protein